MAWAPQVVAVTLIYNAALVLVAMWALAVDREPVILALLVPLQNFFYRQFLYLMALKAVVRALRGVRIGWNPVARLGTSSIGSESVGSDRQPCGDPPCGDLPRIPLSTGMEVAARVRAGSLPAD